MLADAIGEAEGEHTVEPALEDSGMVNHQRGNWRIRASAPQELLDLGSDIFGQRVVLEGADP